MNGGSVGICFFGRSFGNLCKTRDQPVINANLSTQLKIPPHFQQFTEKFGRKFNIFVSCAEDFFAEIMYEFLQKLELHFNFTSTWMHFAQETIELTWNFSAFVIINIYPAWSNLPAMFFLYENSSRTVFFKSHGCGSSFSTQIELFSTD